jgi:hypothetical protein
LPVALGDKRMSLFQTQITNHGEICVPKLAATPYTHYIGRLGCKGFGTMLYTPE